MIIMPMATTEMMLMAKAMLALMTHRVRGERNKDTETLVSTISNGYQITCILWNVRGPQCEVVLKQLHNQGAVLV